MADAMQSIEMHVRATFQWNWSSDCTDITILWFFKIRFSPTEKHLPLS